MTVFHIRLCGWIYWNKPKAPQCKKPVHGQGQNCRKHQRIIDRHRRRNDQAKSRRSTFQNRTVAIHLRQRMFVPIQPSNLITDLFGNGGKGPE